MSVAESHPKSGLSDHRKGLRGKLRLLEKSMEGNSPHQDLSDQNSTNSPLGFCLHEFDMTRNFHLEDYWAVLVSFPLDCPIASNNNNSCAKDENSGKVCGQQR